MFAKSRYHDAHLHVVISHLHPPPSQQNTRLSVWQILGLKLQAFWPLLPVGEAKIKLQKKVNDDDLDLGICEPASRARMAAVAPRHVGRIGGNVLLLAAGDGVLLAELVEAEAVEGVGVGVEGLVEANGVGGDADLGVCGDKEAVGEANIFPDEAFVCDCVDLVRSPPWRRWRLHILSRSGLKRWLSRMKLSSFDILRKAFLVGIPDSVARALSISSRRGWTYSGIAHKS